MKYLIVLITIVFGALYASAQDYNLGEPEHLLDGREFNYQYQNQTAIHIRFEEGQLTYKWIKGPNADKPFRTFPYLSRQLEDNTYLIQWHEEELSNFITLVFNFDTRTVASSVIVKYGQEGQFSTFDSGFISQLKE